MPNNKNCDFVGVRFNKLVVVKKFNSNDGRTRWECLCDCGKITVVQQYYLKTNHTKSCGCERIKSIIERSKKHGYSNERFYDVWRNMIKRCNDKKCASYKNYGKRGIKVCNEWLDLEVFKKWALENNCKDGLELDRKDNDGDYTPENCRFITHLENNLTGRKRFKIGKSGIIGVRQSKSGRWSCKVWFNMKDIYLGTFDTKEEAILIRNNYIDNVILKTFDL